MTKKCKKGDGELFRDWARGATRSAQDNAYRQMSDSAKLWIESRKKALACDNSSLTVLDAPKALRMISNSNMAESGNNSTMNSRLTNLARALHVFCEEEAQRYNAAHETAKHCAQRGDRIT